MQGESVLDKPAPPPEETYTEAHKPLLKLPEPLFKKEEVEDNLAHNEVVLDKPVPPPEETFIEEPASIKKVQEPVTNKAEVEAELSQNE